MFLFLLIKMKAFEMMGQTCAVTERGLTSPILHEKLGRIFPGRGLQDQFYFAVGITPQ